MSKPPERRSIGVLNARRQPIPWPSDRRFRILSIDGGGIRGILPAAFLTELERRHLNGASIGSYFDLITGTSTGGIIALGLGLGLNAEAILKMYLNHGAAIFPVRKSWDHLPVIGWIPWLLAQVRDFRHYRYERAPLEFAIREAVQDRTFGESLRRLVIPSFDGYGEVNVFKTPHHPDFKLDWKERAIDVALATSAAPTFLATYRNGAKQYADGGVWANNPIMLGLIDALSCYQLGRDKVDILSLGCADGEYKISEDQERAGGIWSWREIMSAAMHLQGQNAWGQAGLLIGRQNIVRVDYTPDRQAIPIDDYRRSARELPSVASHLANELGSTIKERFLRELADPYPAYYGPRATG